MLNLPFYSVPRWGAFLALLWGLTLQRGDTFVLREEGIWNLCHDANVWHSDPSPVWSPLVDFSSWVFPSLLLDQETPRLCPGLADPRLAENGHSLGAGRFCACFDYFPTETGILILQLKAHGLSVSQRAPALCVCSPPQASWARPSWPGGLTLMASGLLPALRFLSLPPTSETTVVRMPHLALYIWNLDALKATFLCPSQNVQMNALRWG